MREIRIIAAGSYVGAVDGEPPSLKSLTREITGAYVRRIGRFVQLALVGAGRCLNGMGIPAETATYFSSCRGDLETTLDVLSAMCREGRPPAPFAFINTVGNSTCFHVAQCFGLRGRSQFVTRRHGPLEAALRLAMLDLAEGAVTTALVGSADLCTAPLSEHRERIGVSPDTPVGEASHWFALTTDRELGVTLGVMREVRSFPDDAALRDHVSTHREEYEGAAVASGQHLSSEAFESFRRAAGLSQVFDYRRDLPWYDSQTGHAIHRFVEAAPADRLVHVDGDPSGRRTLLIVDAPSRLAGAPTPRPRDPRIA